MSEITDMTTIGISGISTSSIWIIFFCVHAAFKSLPCSEQPEWIVCQKNKSQRLNRLTINSYTSTQ